MRGKTAKRLRKIALSLKLNPVSSYEPTGAFQHWKGGELVRRRQPLALKACWRRAYLEAKALYKGQVVAEAGVVDLAMEREGIRPFRHRMVDSIKRQGTGPVEK